MAHLSTFIEYVPQDAVNRGWRYAALNPQIAFDRATAPLAGRVAPLVDCVARGEAFARSEAFRRAHGLSDTSSSWQRPWTWADTVFVGIFVGGAVALGALTWNAVSYRRG